jgi:hypothetical protein
MILEKMYSIPALAFFSVLFVGWYVTSTLAYRSKLAKLGAKPRQVPYHLPFGIDVLIEGIQVQSPDFGASDSVQSCLVLLTPNIDIIASGVTFSP